MNYNNKNRINNQNQTNTNQHKATQTYTKHNTTKQTKHNEPAHNELQMCNNTKQLKPTKQKSKPRKCSVNVQK